MQFRCTRLGGLVGYYRKAMLLLVNMGGHRLLRATVAVSYCFNTKNRLRAFSFPFVQQSLKLIYLLVSTDGINFPQADDYDAYEDHQAFHLPVHDVCLI